MKSIIIILTLISFKSYSQIESNDGWYIGGSLGVSFSKEFNVRKGYETLLPQSYLFSMPISYRYNNLIGEIEPTYAGIISLPLSIGYVFQISDKIDFTLQGGVSDIVYPDLEKPIQITQKFYPLVKARFQVMDGFIQASYYGNTYFFSIGLRGYMFDEGY